MTILQWVGAVGLCACAINLIRLARLRRQDRRQFEAERKRYVEGT